jgi:hypothetical protein
MPDLASWQSACKHRMALHTDYCRICTGGRVITWTMKIINLLTLRTAAPCVMRYASISNCAPARAQSCPWFPQYTTAEGHDSRLRGPFTHVPHFRRQFPCPGDPSHDVHPHTLQRFQICNDPLFKKCFEAPGGRAGLSAWPVPDPCWVDDGVHVHCCKAWAAPSSIQRLE